MKFAAAVFVLGLMIATDVAAAMPVATLAQPQQPVLTKGGAMCNGGGTRRPYPCSRPPQRGHV